jgi:hypothetical protein
MDVEELSGTASVVRVPGYRPRGQGSIPGATGFSVGAGEDSSCLRPRDHCDRQRLHESLSVTQCTIEYSVAVMQTLFPLDCRN